MTGHLVKSILCGMPFKCPVIVTPTLIVSAVLGVFPGGAIALESHLDSAPYFAQHSESSSDAYFETVMAQATTQALTTSSSLDGLESRSMGQVTSVSQLSDVQPTDWAFSALQSLVERYGCIAGYPDGTYRGNRAMTRYEFAAGLNACLDRINELIAAGLADKVSQEDLAVLQRLQESFATELATLRGRVDALDARVAEVEANQFSTTTKLKGEVIFDVSDRFDGEDFGGVDIENETVFRYRARLDFVTSFTGDDALHTRLAAGDVQPFSGATVYDIADDLGIDREPASAEGILTPRVGGNLGGDVVLDWLAYYFPVGDRVTAYVAAEGGDHGDYVSSTVSPFFDDGDGGQGSISAFSQRSPIYRIGGGAGAGLNWMLDNDETLAISAGYLADEAAISESGSGLFNGDYAALGQLTFAPGDQFQLALTYVNGFHTDNNTIFDQGYASEFFTGTVPANGTHVEFDTSAITHSYGIQAAYEITPKFGINAFGGYTDVNLTGEEDGEIWYYGLGLAFPDLGKEGNLGGLMVGVEPYLGGDIVGGGPNQVGLPVDTSLHVEAFYRYQINDGLSITPGLIWITAPNQNTNNDDTVVATVRTTFRF